MNEPQHLGLGELGQRVQALSDPAPGPQLRPYQGPTSSPAPAPNGRVIPPYEPTAYEAVEAASSLSPAAQPGPAAPSIAGSTFKPFAPQPQTSPAEAAPSASTATAGFASRESLASPRATVPPQPAGPAPELPAPASSSVTPQRSASSATASAGPGINMNLNSPNAPKSGLQRAISAVRSALPLAQKLLPLLDGDVVTTVGALLTPTVAHHPAQPAVHVNLEPVERALAEVQTGQRELRSQVQEHVTSIKRVEDQLDRVREATDRNTLEQQELVDDLKAVGKRITMFAIIGVVLLVISLGLNAYFIFQLQHILR